jgi:hypothetical protein
MVAVDEGVTQTKDVVFIMRVALVVELKKPSVNGIEMCAGIKNKLIPRW